MADLVRPGSFVVVQDLQHVLTVLLLANEKQPFHVLGLATRLDDVAVRIRAHEVDRFVEGSEVLLRDNADAGRSELLLAECAIVLEPISVWRAPDDELALLPQTVRLRALSEDVVEDDHVGPVGVASPIV